jgi:predicted transposase/invertase (TIGR01784 family)
MTDRLRFAFLEVARFDKTKEQCKTFEDRFLFIMKNLPTFVETPELWADDEPYFQELLQEAEFAKMTDRQQEQYLARMMHEWDYQNSIDFAMEKGEAKGVAKGEANKAIETARLMLADHEPMEKIVKYSGLTEEQVRALM